MEITYITFPLLRDLIMKKHILAVIIASAALAGCSSNSSKNDTPPPQEGVADVIYNEDLHSAAIIGDQGNTAIIIADGNGNAAVTVNGEAYTVQGNNLVNKQGEIIGTITAEDGVAIAHIDDITYTLTVIDGRLIIDSAGFNGDNGWEHVPTPDIAPPPTDDPADMPNTRLINLDVITGEVTVNGEVAGQVSGKDGSVVKDGQVVGYIKPTQDGKGFYFIDNNSDTHIYFALDSNGNVDIKWSASVIDGDWGNTPPPGLDTGNTKWEVWTNSQDFIQIDEINGDRFVQIVKDKDGMIIIQDQDGNRIERPDSGWGMMPLSEGNSLTSAQKAKLKHNVKTLSTEQRQQIKQAIKTKLQTRS